MKIFKEINKLEKLPSNEDGLNVYLIVNTDLNMSCGKIGGQCSHAIQYLVEYFYNTKYDFGNFHERYEAWKTEGRIAKVVLAANTKEFNKIKEEYFPIIVKDRGHTEIENGTETVICLYPMFKDERNKTLKRLQVLKNSDVINTVFNSKTD